MNSLIKNLRVIWVSFCLLSGIFLTILSLGAFGLIAFTFGVLLLNRKSNYWHQVWLGYECLLDVVVGRDFTLMVFNVAGKNKVALYFAALFSFLFLTSFMMVALFYGGFAALKGSRYWIDVWRYYDFFWNAVLAGDHREFVSSRLGKSTIHKHPPVFGFYWADGVVSWWLHQVDKNHVKDAIQYKIGKLVV